jgi:hypothetical protein
MAQAEVIYDEGLWVIRIPKGLLVLTEAQLMDGLRRGKWYQRRHAKRARIPRVEERVPISRSLSEEALSRVFNGES